MLVPLEPALLQATRATPILEMDTTDHLRDVAHLGSANYDSLRTQFFNAKVPLVNPAEIWRPRTTAEVVTAVVGAKTRGQNVGVRSGGHTLTCPALVEGGILIDTVNLNREIAYNADDYIVSFAPSTTSRELSEFLTGVGRFFPFSHYPTVAMGGFILAGGQGWFAREFGYTSESWIEQVEIVMPDGQTIIASQTEHKDIFWAVPGSGHGFFGVITKIWARTIPARKLYHSTVTFDSTGKIDDLIEWAMNACDAAPTEGVDITITTSFADKGSGSGDDSDDSRIYLTIDTTIYQESLEEAQTASEMLSRFPIEFDDSLVASSPAKEASWSDVWEVQTSRIPAAGKYRRQGDSLLTSPQATNQQVSLQCKCMLLS